MTAPVRANHRILAGVLTVGVCVAGALAGLAVADLSTPTGPSGTTPELAGPAQSTAPATSIAPTTAPPPSSEPPTTEAPSTTEAPTTTEGTLPASSVAPTTSVAPSSTATTLAATSTTMRPTTTVPRTTTTRALPAVISVSYLQDATGALAIKPRGGATITLVNSGGQQGQWLLTAGGSSGLSLTRSSGTLGPGQSYTLTVTDTTGVARTTVITGIVAPNTKVNIKVVVK